LNSLFLSNSPIIQSLFLFVFKQENVPTPYSRHWRTVAPLQRHPLLSRDVPSFILLFFHLYPYHVSFLIFHCYHSVIFVHSLIAGYNHRYKWLYSLLSMHGI
jgi:hypothetical protein